MTTSKKCSKCGMTKPLTDYYKDKQNKSGLKGACKTCINLYSKQYWRDHTEKARERDRRWSRKPLSKLSIHRRMAKYRSKEENLVKVRARHLVGSRVRRGSIIKPDTCSICHEKVPRRNLHAHHSDYTKPLEFIWVCSLGKREGPSCHALLEREHHGLQQRESTLSCEGRSTSGRCSSL